MDERTLRVLEFDAVLQAAAALCATVLGQAKVLALRPRARREAIELELDRTAEMVQLIQVEGPLNLDGLNDLKPFAARLGTPGAHLTPEELDVCAQTLTCLERLRRRLQAAAKDYPLLADLGRRFGDHGDLLARLRQTFGPGLTIADEASPGLAGLRRQKLRLKAEIKSTLDQLMLRHSRRGLIQEEIITQRNDRFVLPLKSSRQGELKGIIHDSSASGQTVYFEPLEVVASNNRLGLLAVKERQEIERILLALTDKLREIGPGLFEEVEAAAELDSLQARARLSQRLKATRPELDEAQRLEFKTARHPLLILSGREVVAVDLAFPEDKLALIISGPNAGGKTVALKTMGLLSLMALSGLFIPAAEGSRLPVLKRVAALIGDDQAISQGASTFSARLNWLKEILREASKDCLILIDELGSGTDPAEGSALSLAALDRLIEKEARVLGTTHLNFIKAYAASRPRSVNLSVCFDERTRRPTYELVYGQPGLSNAFEMADQVGLDQELIERAKTYLGGEEERFKTILEELAGLSRRRRKSLIEAEERTRRLAWAEAEVAAAKKELEEERASVINQERERLKELIRKAEAKLSDILAQARAAEAKERERARYRFYEEKGRLRRAVEPGGSRKPQTDRFEAGQTVRIAGLRRPGVLVEEAKEGRLVEVRLAGGVRLKVDPAELAPLEEGGRASFEERTMFLRPLSEPVWPEVNIIGLRVDEALPVVDKALDEAVLSGLDKLAIVHGVGTGALKRAVREHLAGHPQVKRFSSPQGLKGAAVTEVELGG